jgi:hypothetical protein
MTVRRWSMIAACLSLLGGAAWLAKFAVIVATDGRVATTGAAAWFMRLGLVCLFAGGTGGPLWLARRGRGLVRAAAVLLSPVAVAASLVAVGSLAARAVGTRGPAYLHDEIGIAAAALVWLAVGAGLLARVRRAAAGAAGPFGTGA